MKMSRYDNNPVTSRRYHIYRGKESTFIKQSLEQKRRRRCVLITVRQCLRMVFCLSVARSPFSFLGKQKFNTRICNLTNFATLLALCHCHSSRSVGVSRAQRRWLTGALVPTSLCSASLYLKERKKEKSSKAPV